MSYEDEFDIEMLKQAYRTASGASTDPSTQNGAILICPESKMILVQEANHFPIGVRESFERWERPLKYSYVEHAERNAIYLAARFGIQTEGLIMYCPWFACADCARAIVQSGIKEVIGHDWDGRTGSSPQWTQSVKIGDEILYEAGVKFRRIKTEKLGIKIRFNGEVITV